MRVLLNDTHGKWKKIANIITKNEEIVSYTHQRKEKKESEKRKETFEIKIQTMDTVDKKNV